MLIKSFLYICIFIVNTFATNILILNSYENTFEWTRLQSSTIIENIQKARIDKTDIFVEYMDAQVFKITPQREKNIITYLQDKYKNKLFDIVVTTDDSALKFVNKNKDIKIFKNAKVFFSGVHDLTFAKELDKNLYAGIFEKENPLANLKIAKEINKRLKIVYVVFDGTVTSLERVNLYKKKYANIKKIKFIYMYNQDIEKIIQKLKNYDKNSVMILQSFSNFTRANKHISYVETAQILSKYYKNPMLVNKDIYVNIPDTNIIGGDCTDGEKQGYVVSQMIIKYLNGTKIQNLGFDLSHGNKFYLNVENLKKFGLNVNDFNQGNPKLINELTSFYNLHSNLIDLFLVILLLVSLFLIILTKKNMDLKKSLVNFQTLAETTFGATIVINSKFIIEYANQRVLELTGYTHDEIIGANATKFIHKDDQKKVFKMAREGDENPKETKLLKKDQNFFYALLRSKRIKLDKKYFAIVSAIDITNIKIQEQKITQMNENLKIEIKNALEENTKQLEFIQEQSKLASMGEMIGSIAHQWRQPLNALNINIQNLDDDYDEGLIDKKFIDDFIYKNRKIIEFMDKTIDDFRNFFKIDKEKTDFSVMKVINEVINMELNHLKNNQIKIVLTGEDLNIHGFENEFKQVMLNLLSNAKDAIMGQNIDDGKIEIILKDRTISVKDNGGGITERAMGRIFEPYFTTKEQGSGTGIGLYMSKTIIEKNMGWTLRAENIDDGALFEIITQD
ncbi:MAG: PAS domain-containing sensor histidine kinase [Sulfurospirillaceae bacterium]|nr:PAS domain-containing sensor histidine kinase [Sulfurospirillaceae bacterium]